MNTKDKNHERSKKILSKIENKEKIVTDGVILESITLCGNLFGVKLSTALYHNIKDNYNVYNTRHLYDDGMITYLKYGGNLSLVDTLLIEAMKELNTHKIVSFDSSFDNKKGIFRIH